MNKHKKTFLKLPEYPGGKEAFKKYIRSNLKYPEMALLSRTQGIVFLTAEIDDKGNVGEVIVNKGLGKGCDEEAQRLIKNVRFGSVKNRGVHVKSTRRFKIEFKLPPKPKIVYEIISEQSAKKIQTENTQNYSYTVRIDPQR